MVFIGLLNPGPQAVVNMDKADGAAVAKDEQAGNLALVHQAKRLSGEGVR